MKSSSNPPSRFPSQEDSGVLKEERLKLTLVDLKTVAMSIQKRLTAQALSRLIIHSSSHQLKKSKLNIVAFLLQSFLRRKTRSAFQSVVMNKAKRRMAERAGCNLLLKCRWLHRNCLKNCLLKLILFKHSPKSQFTKVTAKLRVAPLISPRLSECSDRSNILSVSQDSLSEKEEEYEDRRHYRHSDHIARSEGEEIGKMALSSEVKESLLRMQKYNRLTYQSQSQKILKEAVAAEVKRLESLKSKQMRNKLSDNQLTITCLHNHICLLSAISEDLANSNDSEQRNQIQQRLMMSNKAERSFPSKNQQSSFTQEEVTTLNILATALRARKYKDIKREADYLVKKTQKQQLSQLIKELSSFICDGESIEEGGREREKEKIETTNLINLFDNHLRTDKIQQLQALQNKSKEHPYLQELSNLFQTVISTANELKKLKRKDLSSGEKFKSLEKDKLKRVVEKENQELKRELKNIQNRNNELSLELERLKDNFKKVDRVHPSLLPKRPLERELPSESKHEELPKRTKGSQSALTKTDAKDRQQDKQLQEKWEKRTRELQQQVDSLKAEEIFLRRVTNEVQDFKKYYSILKEKAQKKESFARELNQYKRLHKESLFLEILQDLAADKSFKHHLLTQLSTVHTIFNDGSWKRKCNSLVVKNQNEDSQGLNKIIDTLVALSKAKEEQASTIQDLENAKKGQASRIAEIMGLKEEITGLKNEIKEQREEISRMTEHSARTEQFESVLKAKSPERIQRSSADKQMIDLKIENERLKKQLEVNHKQVKVEKGKPDDSRSITKEWDLVSKCVQLVLKKRAEGQSYQIYINNFKRNYSQSVFLQLLELLSAMDSEKAKVASTLKSISNAFEEGFWKKKQLNLFSKGEDQPFLTINRIAELLLSSYRQQEEYQNNLKELEALRNKNITLTQTSEDLRVQLREKSSALTKEMQKQREKPLGESQVLSFQAQIQSLKHSLQEKEARIFQLNSSMSNVTVSTQRMNELEEVYDLLDSILEKRNSGQSFQSETRNFKKKYPQSSFHKLFETIMKQDEEISFLTSNLKTLNTMLSNGIWRPKAIPSDRDRAYYIQLNKLIDLIETFQKEREEAQSKMSSFSAELSTAQQQIEDQKEQLSRFKAAMNEPADLKKRNNEIDLCLSRDVNDLKLANDRLLTDKNTLRQELQNAIKSNALSNADIEKLHHKEILLEKEVKQLRETETMERSRDNERRKLENRVQELQGHLSFMEEKMHNYEMLFQRYKEEKDNLVLMIQEKEEEYQLSRENEEMHLKEKQERDEKILQLKQRYEETQLSIREIQREVDRLMAEKQTQDIQRQSAQELLQIQLSDRENQLASLREKLELSEKTCYKLGSQVEMGEVRLRNELAMKDSEKQFFKKEVELHQLELAQFKQRSHEERKEVKERCEQLNRELTEERRLREEERVLLKNYLAAEGQPRSHSMGEDSEKNELRRQLELANQELTAMVRSSEGEKRQIRQLVDSLNGQLQLQSAVFNEEKKVLKEGIERARNQEYQIHSQKMRKLREDIQALREQNQRLISIIDSNEQAFNELIAEHRDLSLRNSSLVQDNSALADEQARLESQLIRSTHQNEDLTHQLRLLEEQLGIIENQVFSAMEEGQVHSQQLIGSRTRQQELEGTVNLLSHQRQILQARLVQENRKTQQLRRRVLELEGGHQSGKEGGDYSRYLQDKLSTQEGEIKRYLQNEKTLIAKIQQLMTNVSTVEREKMQYLSTRREKEIQLVGLKNAGQKDMLLLQQKINKLEQTLANKGRELQQDRKDSFYPDLNPRLQQLQEHNRALQTDIEKLKTAGQALKRQKIAFQGKVQINSKAVIEAKLISNKYVDLEADFKELEGKLAAMQTEDGRKQKGKVEEDSPSLNSLDLQLMAQRTMTLKKEEEVTWLKTQLSLRENEIHKLRSTELGLSQELRRTQEALQLKDHWQNQFEKEALGHGETRRQNKTQEEFYIGELQRVRLHEKEATQSLLLSKQNLRVLNQSYQQLLGQQNQLKEEAHQRKGESEVLKQIVLQLDSEFPLSGDDEHLELQILQKISFEVEDLLTSNQKLRDKCDSLEISIFQGSTEVSEQSFLFSLHAMAENLLIFLQQQQLLNSRQAETSLRQLLQDSNHSAQGYICNLEVFLQTLVTTLASQSFQSCVEVRLQLDNAKRVLEESRNSSPREVLTRVRELLR